MVSIPMEVVEPFTINPLFPRMNLTSVLRESIQIPIIPEIDNFIQNDSVENEPTDSQPSDSPLTLIQIPFLNEDLILYEEQDSFYTAFNDSIECIDLTNDFNCSVCFQDVSYAFTPGCSRQSCKDVWFCEACIKLYFSNDRESFFGECTKCTRKMHSLRDNLGNEVNVARLYRKCSFLQ